MKRSFKATISMILVVAMLFGIVPFGVFADEESDKISGDSIAYVWGINREKGKFYSDLKSAWDAAKENSNILMLKDWKTTEVLIVPSRTDINLYMNGHSIDRGLTSAKGSGEVFLLHAETSLSVYGGDGTAPITETTTSTIKGGYNSDGGGGIHIQEDSGLYLYGVTVSGNTTTDRNGGGGVRLQGDKTYLYMDKFSCISDNKAPKGDGGGVSIHGKGAQVEGGTIKNNTAAESGGGICTYGEGSKITSVKITDNIAGEGKKGGGIYMAQGSGAAVFGCTIEANKVNGNGGGIHVDGNGGSLSYSTVTKNEGKYGGGIYIDTGDSLDLSGDITVNNNTSTVDKQYANLYLETTSKKSAYITGYPSGGELRISWDKEVRKGDIVKISKDSGGYSAKYIKSDVNGYYPYWSWDTEDGNNDRYLRCATTNYNKAIIHTNTDVSVGDRYHVTENGYKEKYDLQEGIFSYKASTGGDLDAVYYYSDGYFADDPKVYNEHLSTMSLSLVMSAFNAAHAEFDDEMHNEGYANRFRNGKQLLSDIGFADRDIHISDSFTYKPTDASIGVMMGAKVMSDLEDADKEYILLPIAVRGAGYESEWASNVTLGESKEAAGFSDAATKVMAELEKFISSDTSIDIKGALAEGRVKFWVVGFSRAAATANLTAKRLTDTYGEKNSIYAYCFEAPKGGVDSETLVKDHTYEGKYLNIHNIINSGDIVPFVGPQEMGFKRYGVDHFVPGTASGEIVESVFETTKELNVTTYEDNTAYEVGDKDYTARRENMKYQLALIDDTITFDDYFSLATMNYVSASRNGMVGPLKNGTDSTAAEWIPVFVKNLVEWASNGTYSWSTVDGDGYDNDYRRFYSTNVRFCGKDYMTVEEALQIFTKLLFGLEDTDEFMEAMMYRVTPFIGSNFSTTDFYIGVITMWDEQAQYRQRWYIEDIWELLTDEETVYPGGIPVPTIYDFVSGGITKKQVDDAGYSLLAFLYLFICRDYDNKPDPALSGVDTKQIHLGTLLYNSSSVLQCHYPEICMAWLRTYDSHYVKNDSNKYADTCVNLTYESDAVPTDIEIKTEIKDGISFVTLTSPFKNGSGVDAGSSENGTAVYYQIYVNDELKTDWTLYQDPISFDTTTQDVYTIKAYNVRYMTKSDTVTFTDDQIRETNTLYGTLLGKGSPVAIGALGAVIAAAGVGTFFYVKKKKTKKNDVDE